MVRIRRSTGSSSRQQTPLEAMRIGALLLEELKMIKNTFELSIVTK